MTTDPTEDEAAVAEHHRIRRHTIAGVLIMATVTALAIVVAFGTLAAVLPQAPSPGQILGIGVGIVLAGLAGLNVGQLARTLTTDQFAEPAAITAGYRERTQLLAYLTAHHASAVLAEPGSDPTWPDYYVLFVPSPAGQLSWRIRPEHTHLLRYVERVTADDPRAEWDGHSTEEKSLRLEHLVDELTDPTDAD